MPSSARLPVDRSHMRHDRDPLRMPVLPRPRGGLTAGLQSAFVRGQEPIDRGRTDGEQLRVNLGRVTGRGIAECAGAGVGVHVRQGGRHHHGQVLARRATRDLPDALQHLQRVIPVGAWSWLAPDGANRSTPDQGGRQLPASIGPRPADLRLQLRQDCTLGLLRRGRIHPSLLLRDFSACGQRQPKTHPSSTAALEAERGELREHFTNEARTPLREHFR